MKLTAPLRRLFRRDPRPAVFVPPVAPGAPPVSRPESPSGLGRAWDAFLPLPDDTPFEMLRVYRHLRDAIPDVSDAVWTWKRLCQTERRVDIAETLSDAETAAAHRRIHELDARAHTGEGIDVLLDTLYASLFTFGAAALELVPGNGRSGIHDVVPVDVWTVRFRRENGQLQAWQVLPDGDPVRLPMERFLYIALDRDGTSPYGRSMLRSIPFVLRIQQRLLEDMARAVHNAGWSRLHLRYTPDTRLPGETPDAHRARITRALTDLRDTLTNLAPDQNLVTTDTTAANVLTGDQCGIGFYDNHKAVEEQVITGLHMMPVLMGRNYGSTETYGTAQFEVVNRQVETVNRGMATGDVIVFDGIAHRTTLNGIDITAQVTGDYPQLGPDPTTFLFLDDFDSSHHGTAIIQWRPRWL